MDALAVPIKMAETAAKLQGPMGPVVSRELLPVLGEGDARAGAERLRVFGQADAALGAFAAA